MRSEGASSEAIEAVYRDRGADFLRFALAKTGDPDRARDALQEGFARAIRSRGGFRGSGSLEAWICRCVLNAAHDAARTDAREHALEPEAVAGDPGESDATVRAAVLRLPQRQRDALFLRYYLDFDYAAIAEALGVEIGTVSATLHAARQTLARALQEVLQ
jgi:RNA polymerase sigma factor (sigma-70 family)